MKHFKKSLVMLDWFRINFDNSSNYMNEKQNRKTRLSLFS